MNGVICCRVSSKEQVEGTSLDSQVAACMEFAKEKGISVLKSFIEQGESAKFADRTKLLELIDFCSQHKGKVHALIVWKLDCFARNVTDHYNVKAMLLKYGVSIYSVTEPIDSNPEGKLMETILAGFAQFDNDIRAMRTVQGMKQLLQSGIIPWHAPIGYISSTTKGGRKTAPDQPDPTTFPLLQQVWKEFATGAYTKADICRRIEALGIRSKNGLPLNAQAVDKLFRNRFYAGWIADPWTGEEREGIHVPMITKAEYALVQKVIARRSNSQQHQRHREDLPMRGWARCHGCRHYLTGSFSKGRNALYGYYHCINRHCLRYGKSIPASAVHQEFIDMLTESAIRDPLVQEVCRGAQSEYQRSHALSKVSAQKHTDRRTADDMELKELIQLRARGKISDSQFDEHKAEIDARRLSYTAPAKQQDATSFMNRIANGAKTLRDLVGTWRRLKGPSRIWFQRVLLPMGFVVGQIRTAQKGLCISLFEQLLDPDSSKVPLTLSGWNQLLLEVQGFSEIESGSEELSEEVLAMFQEKKKGGGGRSGIGTGFE
jgi:site-specific DNA recombinase